MLQFEVGETKLSSGDYTEVSLLHHMLMGPLILERLPGWLALIVLVGFVGIAPVLWRNPYNWAVLVFHSGMATLDWLSLVMLPTFKRSYGPVRPPLFALTLVRAFVTVFIGLLGHWGRGALGAVIFVQTSILAVSIYGLWIEPFHLGITHQTLQTSKLDPDLPPVRILHLGDLHIERITIRERRLQSIIEKLAPDVIVFSGDFVSLSYQDDPESFASIRDVVGKWQAPHGIFVVSGSPLVESQDMVAQFVKGMGVCWLRDETVKIEVHGQQVTLLGVTCAHNSEDDALRMCQLSEQVPDTLFKLLIFHSPDIAPQASQAGIDLYVCGHTHGGQLRLPFIGALITSSSLGKQYEMGRYDVDRMALYVSRGIGMEGASAPRLRLLCPPEVILWTLTGR